LRTHHFTLASDSASSMPGRVRRCGPTQRNPSVIGPQTTSLPGIQTKTIDMQPYGCILWPRMDAVFKALADASRRKLLDALFKNNGQTLSELCEHLDMTRQAVTKHLVLLEKAKLVTVVWRGREKLHYLNPVPLHEIHERWIGKYESHRLQALSDLKKHLEKNKTKKE
jgi:DNA-binding transcriptional ArsR family regulator